MISCPLCCQSQFSSIDLLRTTLINAMHGPFMCPICNEIQHGLDNLAAHLSKHNQIVPSKNANHIETNAIDVNTVIRSNSTITSNKQNNANQMNFCKLQDSENQSFTTPVQCADNNLVQFEHVTEKVISSSPILLDQKAIFSSNPEIKSEACPNQPNNDIIQVFFCHLCACTFRSLELQQMHLQLVHELNVNQIESKVNESRNFQLTSDTIDSNSLHCNLCSKRFKMIGSLRLHVRMVHGVSHVPQKMRSPRNKHPDNVAVNSLNTNLVHPLPGHSSCTANSAGESMIMVKSLANNDADQLQATHSHNYQMEHSENDNDNYGAAGILFGKDDNRLDADDNSNGSNINKDKETIAQNDDRSHECDICNKRFTTKYFLKKHRRIHTGETPYMCELCNRTFTFQQSYHRHLSSHSNDRPHICLECGRAFKESSTLYNHQRIHSGEKPFVCETCGKRFRQRVSYLVHRRIHTGDMPYNCNTCNKNFRYKISLRTHKCTGKKETESMSSINNDNELTFITTNVQETKPSSEQILDEFITESCNRLDIVDHNNETTNNDTTMLYTCENTENGNQTNQSTTAYDCDSFNLNDLLFCDGETTHTDLANVTPSMSEIFPQTMDILNALYEQV